MSRQRRGIPGRDELAVPVAEQELDAVGALAARAIVLISNLAHIHEGSPGHPFGPYNSEIPSRTEPPAPEPAGQDTVLIAAGEVKTVLVALDIAPDYQRDRAELCADSRRPPDYVIVVAASDWLNERYPAAAASLTQALKAGQDRHPDPEPDLEAEP
jgi:hypothetical protein